MKIHWQPREPKKEKALKVLLVRVGAMGDVLHGLPAAAALRERLPDCFIGWAVEPKWLPLLQGEGAVVDRIHEVPTREWKRRPISVATLRDIARLRRDMIAEEYDLCVDLQGAIKSAVIGRMAQAKYFVGPQKPKERQARALYGLRMDVRSKHVIEQACELVKGGLAAMVEDWHPVKGLAPAKVTLPVDAAAELWADQRLAELGVGEAGFVLLAPTAGWGAKQWLPRRYAELSKRLAQEGYRVLVNAGGAANEGTIAEITCAGDAVAVESDVAGLVALTRRARLVVGGDTGPVHLAAALGRPVVALFGPTDPGRNGPYFIGAKVRVVRSPTSRVDYARYQEIEAGLATVTEDEVLKSALQLLGASSGESLTVRPEPVRNRQVTDGFGTAAFQNAGTWKTSAFRSDSLNFDPPEKKEADEDKLDG